MRYVSSGLLCVGAPLLMVFILVWLLADVSSDRASKLSRIADLVAEVLGAAGLTKELSTHADKRDSHDGRD